MAQSHHSSLQTIVGQGRLHVNGHDFGSVTYSLRLSEDDAPLGDGVLSGNTPGIAAAGAHGAAGLALETGDLLDIHVHAANLTRGLFVLSCAIPGL